MLMAKKKTFEVNKCLSDLFKFKGYFPLISFTVSFIWVTIDLLA